MTFEKTQRKRLFRAVSIIAVLVLLCGVSFAPAAPDSQSSNTDAEEQAKAKQEKKESLLKMKNETLERLYKLNPKAKAVVEGAVGYGVFEVKGVNAVFYVAYYGSGLVVDNATGKVIYMKSARAGTGPGVGYKASHQVFVFKSKTVFDTFTTVGMDVGTSADATVKIGDTGTDYSMSESFNPYIGIYQLTDIGLVLQANWGGTKFFKDPELN